MLLLAWYWYPLIFAAAIAALYFIMWVVFCFFAWIFTESIFDHIKKNGL